MADSSDLGLMPQEATALISQDRMSKYLFIAALTVVTYDTILTFSKEFQCIWQRRFGTGTVLYLIIRYGTILQMLFDVFRSFVKARSAVGCKALDNTAVILEILCSLAYAVFDCVRIWGICRHRWLPTILVFSLSMFVPAINIYGNAFNFWGTYIAVVSGPLAQCWIITSGVSYPYWGIITRAISIAADATVLGLTLWKTAYIFKENRNVRGSSKLTTTLAYNGSIHFSILLLLNILAMLLDIFSVAIEGKTVKNASIFVFLETVIISIILSHFILDLRSIYPTTNNSLQSNSKQSTLHFASAIEGNMGATLNGFWASEREENFEDAEDIQYSEYPFSTGLANIKDDNAPENREDMADAGPPDTINNSGPSGPHTGEIGEIELQEIA